MPVLFRYFVLFCLLVTARYLAAQNRTIDSLEKTLAGSKEDTVRAKILDDLSWEYNAYDIKKSEVYAQQLLALSKKIKYKKGEGNAYANLGATSYLQSNYAEAIAFFQHAVETRKKLNDLPGTGGALNNIAMSLQQQSDYTGAITYYLEALKIFEEINDEKRAAQTYVNISSLYTELKNFPLAIKYASAGLSSWQNIGNKLGMSGAYVNLGNSYHGLKNYNEAIKYYEKALDLLKNLNNKYSVGRIYHNLGTIYTESREYDKAARYLAMEIPLKEEAGDKEGMSSAHHSLGHLYLKTGKTDLAVSEFKKALEIAKAIGSRDNIKWAYLSLKEAYWAKGKLEDALRYATLYDMIKDTLYNETSSRQIAEMQTRYESEKKEKENLELKRKTEIQSLELQNEAEKRKNILLLGISVFGLAGGSVFFLYNRKKMKEKARHASEMAAEEKKRFTATIEAEEKERSRIAQELHDGLGQLLSSARLNVAGLEDSVPPEDKAWLEKSLKIIDDACVEVRHISHNMMPSALIRLGLIPALQELVNNINASKKIRVDFSSGLTTSPGKSASITIYRIIQEILNNMIRHSGASLIKAEISQVNENVSIRIQDNGIGFDTQKIKESKGIGWKNVYSRISMLNGSIEITSAPQKGTLVFIQLKLKNE